jgi:hypothetical protein
MNNLKLDLILDRILNTVILGMLVGVIIAATGLDNLSSAEVNAVLALDKVAVCTTDVECEELTGQELDLSEVSYEDLI